MTSSIMRRVCLGLAALSLAGTSSLLAQVDAEHMMSLSFAFTNPGARAHGMGGAYVGMSDDAATTFVNPAGMVVFESAQGAMELAYGETPTYTSRFDGEYGILPSLVDDDAGLTYISYTKPLGSERQWSIGFYYVDLMHSDFERKYSLLPLPGEVAANPTHVRLRSHYWVTGVSLATRLSSWLAAGVSVGHSRFTLDGWTRRFDEYVDPEFGTISELLSEQSHHADDSNLLATFGILISLGDNLSFGASWQNEQKYDIDVGLALTDFPAYSSQSTTIYMPSRLAIGLACRLSEHFTLSLERNMIEYSDVYRDATRTFYEFLFTDTPLEVEFRDMGRPLLRFDDVTQDHVGLEYVTGGVQRSVAWRIGAWTDRAHRPYGDRSAYDELGFPAAPWLTEPQTEEVVHYTAGIGVSFSSFVLDVAIDRADDAGGNATKYFLSMLFRL